MGLGQFKVERCWLKLWSCTSSKMSNGEQQPSFSGIVSFASAYTKYPNAAKTFLDFKFLT